MQIVSAVLIPKERSYSPIYDWQVAGSSNSSSVTIRVDWSRNEDCVRVRRQLEVGEIDAELGRVGAIER